MAQASAKLYFEKGDDRLYRIEVVSRELARNASLPYRPELATQSAEIMFQSLVSELSSLQRTGLDREDTAKPSRQITFAAKNGSVLAWLDPFENAVGIDWQSNLVSADVGELISPSTLIRDIYTDHADSLDRAIETAQKLTGPSENWNGVYKWFRTPISCDSGTRDVLDPDSPVPRSVAYASDGRAVLWLDGGSVFVKHFAFVGAASARYQIVAEVAFNGRWLLPGIRPESFLGTTLLVENDAGDRFHMARANEGIYFAHVDTLASEALLFEDCEF